MCFHPTGSLLGCPFYAGNNSEEQAEALGYEVIRTDSYGMLYEYGIYNYIWDRGSEKERNAIL